MTTSDLMGAGLMLFEQPFQVLRSPFSFLCLGSVANAWLVVEMGVSSPLKIN
ncbi:MULTISPECIES: hypothetical protein [unclassified Leptolyngbya]|uniref:hypothetical protein n=1 Tax=unclassified Leptolyngbya TaxID=2650499 RepID=UPI0016898C72|nr:MULTISPECIES: hypothetical protein [unclassified Leptolyngbya]MBD1910829.1 hypothetical protein [Leptolyngbya sp. FACHB-8]MBD2153776.1 hypothetical protein [Leptolyngbya sp. FACHB-16]